MPALLYECFSGIAGNMNLGALIDVGVPEDHLRSELKKLELEEEFEFSVSRTTNRGIAGTLVRVSYESSNTVRNLSEIRKIIQETPYSDSIKRASIDTFELLAKAEATVHNIDIDKVHFHEVGAVDAIVDIVGSAIAMEYLKPSQVYCGPIELGSGTVTCDHGTLPVPAPATLQLLLNVPVTRGQVAFEATTPTGAALLCHYVDRFEVPSSFKTTRIGYGLGEKKSSQPNVVRVSLGEVSEAITVTENVEIDCNIDDMSPEAYEYVMDQLFSLGALDVFITPIVMKKSRPAHKLTVLVPPARERDVVAEMLRSTTTVGVRMHTVKKQMLDREMKVVDTSIGTVQVKIIKRPDGTLRWKLEHDDVLSVARKSKLSYPEVKQIMEREVTRVLDKHE